MHCGAVDHQSSYEHARSDLAQRSLIIVCKYCGESRLEKKTFFLVNYYKCVGPISNKVNPSNPETGNQTKQPAGSQPAEPAGLN